MSGDWTTGETSKSMDILAAVFFVVAGLWLVLAMGYSCMIVTFLRMRSRGQLDAIYDENFGRIHVPCTNHRFYLPVGCFFRRYMHHLQQEQRRTPSSPRTDTATRTTERYMTTDERRRAMEVLLWEERQNEKTVHCNDCKIAPVAVPASAPVPEASEDTSTDIETGTGTAELDSDLEGPMCLICLDEFTESDNTVLHSPMCSHDYHKDCIMDWLQRHGTRECPCCRVEMITEDEVWEAVKRLRKEKRKESRRETNCCFLSRQESTCTEEESGENNNSTHDSETSNDDDVIMVNPTLSLNSASSEEAGAADTLADANV
jgi:hypothetical protein